jgi:hypothetical protein
MVIEVLPGAADTPDGAAAAKGAALGVAETWAEGALSPKEFTAVTT